MSRLEVFRRERHILVTASSAGHAAHGQLEREMQLQLDADLAQVSVPSFVACAFLASRSDAIGILPSKLADYLICDLPLAQFKPPISLPRIEISQIWHERVNRDPAHRWLRSTIFDLFRPGRRGSKAQT
jgi:DNA-binding transcriptional LysR family regulator